MTRHDKNDAGRFFETASKEELIDYLVKTIHNEVSKGDDADCDLVRECSDWLDELTEDEIVFTPEELERNLERIKAKTVSDKPVKIRKKVAWKNFVRVALIAAVIFTISLLSLSAVAANQGYDSTWTFLITNVSRILGMDSGDELLGNSVSIIKNTGAVDYNGIEELLSEEKINIMYPHVMPNNVTLQTIYQSIEDNGKYTLSFGFSDKSYIIYVTNYYTTDINLLEKAELISANNINFYTSQKNDALFHAICQYNGFEYNIQCNSYEDLIFIINNMKG